ncbi:response regulator [Methylobacterium sp. Leaf466]|uniref:response regulator n=1 Tax=Methylobacterium sp. Leaf466 TaxID=1736386 RepID=UPI0006FBA904|nr:response regulator [Methylobacterium sp. Leaf466]KQT77945.1 response regulator [Methylobacterium sp. Leaf466]
MSALRILVVEDEALIALELGSLLQDLGHEVIGTAVGSAEAIALGLAGVPDVAFVDIHLMDGPTGVRVSEALSADPRITLIFMTANDKRIPEDFAGAIGVIAKPYSERTVMAALDYVAALRAGAEPGGGRVEGFRLAGPARSG